MGVDVDGGVEEGDVAAGGFGFGEGVAGVGFVEEHLALEVGGLDEVAVDEGEGADAGAGEEGGGGGSGGADADDGDVGAGEELLAGVADAGRRGFGGSSGRDRRWGLGRSWGWADCGGCVRGGLRVVGGERRHEGSIRLEGNLRGRSGKGGANPREVDCICKMKAIRDQVKAVCLRPARTGPPQDERLTRERAAFEFANLKVERKAALARSEWLSEREMKRLSARLLGVEAGMRRRGWVRWAMLLMLGCAGLALRAQTVDTVAPPGQRTAGDQGAQVINALPALQPSLWSKAGTTVTAVRFAGVTFGEKNAIVSELKQKVGEPLDPDKVRADMRRLFASGLYREYQRECGARRGMGVALVYSGQPQYFVGRVTIAGVKNERLASLLEFATRLDPGTPFTDGALATAVEAVKESLAENGFYIPKVALATKVDDAERQVNATFTIDTGPQARVGGVDVGGNGSGD